MTGSTVQPVHSGAAALDLLRGFRGRTHLPGDPGYDAQRATWSGAVDQRPAVIAEAMTPSDVQAAVITAREHGLPIAVQSTGHGTLVGADGAVLIKTGRMREVLVDGDRRVARVGPGATWAHVIAAAAPFGLAPVSGSHASVGVAGFTLGGGVGWLSRRFGFAADSLLRAEVVTAEGQRLTATADRNADLFWALRGGGGNFGLVTAMELRLHPVARAFGGTALFPVHRAAETLAFYRDWAERQPDELHLSLSVLAESPEPWLAGPVLAISGFHVGTADAARRALAPLWRAAGMPLADSWRPMSYADAGTIAGTPPRQFELLEDLDDDLVEHLVELVAGDQPRASAVELRHWGGAMARWGTDSGPVGHRDVPFSVTLDAPAGPDSLLARRATGGSFLNFLHDPTRTHTAYTDLDYRRLRHLKRVHDPGNVLGRVHNIPPAPAPASTPA